MLFALIKNKNLSFAKFHLHETLVLQIPACNRAEHTFRMKYGIVDRHTHDVGRECSDHIDIGSDFAFSIADGQLPSNVKAGYVIRRILRRAVRYGYTFLGFSEPFLCRLIPQLVSDMGEAYPELVSQQKLIESVIREEELAFLRTLDRGIKLLDEYMAKSSESKTISGKDAFILYDTYGFPIDLTEMIAAEKGFRSEEHTSELQSQR